MGYETKARENHRNGNNCSASLFRTFADQLGMSEDEAARMAPPPRSDGGKCGGFLSGRKLLEMIKPEAVEEFEQRFLEQNGDNKCARRYRFSPGRYIGHGKRSGFLYISKLYRSCRGRW